MSTIKLGIMVCILTALLAIATLSLLTLLVQIDKDINNYQAENECIQHYIYQGVERKNIVRDNGVCYVKEKL